MRSVVQIFVLCCFFFFTYSVHAEGGCPPGQYPQNGQGFQNCVPIPGYSNQQAPQAPPERWEDRWQAIAADMEKGALGVSTGAKSENEAGQAAAADCRAKGGISCNIQVTQRNGCVAMVVGEKTANFRGAATLQEAEQAGESQCNKGNTKCVVYYHSCDMPVRIQ